MKSGSATPSPSSLRPGCAVRKICSDRTLLSGLLLSVLLGCDRTPQVVQHPTPPNQPPSNAALIASSDVPPGLSPDQLASWTVARRSFENAAPLYRLGALTGEGPEVFGRIDDVVLTRDDRVFVLDGLAQIVRIFDQTGQYVGGFGGLGDGPEELRGASRITMDSSGDILVFGTGRHAKVFSPTTSGYRFSELRALPISGGVPCITPSGRIIVTGADTRTERNVLLHEMPSQPDKPVRSFGSGYSDPSPFVRFMLANLGPVACMDFQGTEVIAHAFAPLSYVRLMSAKDGSVSWTARLSDHYQLGMEATATSFIQENTADWDIIAGLLPYLDSHLLLLVERFRAMASGDVVPESSIDTYLLDLATGNGARIATGPSQVMEATTTRYAVVTSDPYPQIEIRIIEKIEEMPNDC